jgi:16S rRNA (cytosine1402-N4)-methyltransferase
VTEQHQAGASRHIPVLLQEVLAALQPEPGGRFIDCTAGGGGHAEALLERIAPGGRLLAVDRDESAVRRLQDRFGERGDACEVAWGNFADVGSIAAERGWEGVDGVLFDFGMSSDQVDDPERGFGFSRDGPLDMRMDRSRGLTAAELVADLEEDELADLLRRYGEEPAARRIARALVQARAAEPVRTTGTLAALVEQAVGGRRGRRIHPATRTFQALRIAVNRELESMEQGLESAIDLVRPRGRVAAISFHSLEDRVVKQLFGAHVGREESLQQGGSRRHGLTPRTAWVVKRPATARPAEVEVNPRARSAKLRVVERME